ncbi:MAG TPA: hypothetical protein VI958_10975 [Acidobacteriota bacterium]
MPEDAIGYINFYDLKRIHEDVQDTRFYDVLAHWLDTGMKGDKKANPLFGGLLEKTLLDVAGQEFAIAFAPSENRVPDFVAAGSALGGSEFFLKLALLSSKKAQRIQHDGHTIYQFETKMPSYPNIYVFLKGDYVYASSDLNRIQRAADEDGQGPAFLKELDVEAIPENTFLFVRGKEPNTSVLMYGENRSYRLRASADAMIKSHLPVLEAHGNEVLRMQTNAAEALDLPSGTYILQSVEGASASSVILSFPDARQAKDYEQRLVMELTKNMTAPAEVSHDRINCYRYSRDGINRFLCNYGASLLLAQGDFALAPKAGLRKLKTDTLPLTMRVEFQPNTIQEYLEKVQNKDWSRFSDAKEFYFLSGLKRIAGAVDGNQNEILVEIN